jgi:dTDP-4-dehydrorhamnose 3,5-epimerase
MANNNLPKIIKGEIKKDERGAVSFVNGFDFSKIKRFYIVENKNNNQIRAWHGHKKEEKFAYLLSGIAIVGAVAIDNWKNPSKKSKVLSFKLSADKPQILYIPKGYVNGFKSLTKDARLMFFSTSTLKDSLNDDIRFDEKYWNI